MNDYIKREDAIERLSYHTDFYQSDREFGTEEMLYKDSALKEISDIPSADVRENVRGEWISTGFMEVKCSNCKETFHELESANFCPNCGAEMGGES